MQEINDDDAAACASRILLLMLAMLLALHCRTFIWINSTQRHSHALEAHQDDGLAADTDVTPTNAMV